MLKNIACTERRSDGYYSFVITDTCFKERFCAASRNISNVRVLAGIIHIYKNRKLNIIPNLIASYIKCGAEAYVNDVLTNHYIASVKEYPSLQYNTLYYSILRYRLRNYLL